MVKIDHDEQLFLLTHNLCHGFFYNFNILRVYFSLAMQIRNEHVWLCVTVCHLTQFMIRMETHMDWKGGRIQFILADSTDYHPRVVSCWNNWTVTHTDPLHMWLHFELNTRLDFWLGCFVFILLTYSHNLQNMFFSFSNP